MKERTKEILGGVVFAAIGLVIFGGMYFDAHQEGQLRDRERAAVVGCTPTDHQRVEKKSDVSFGTSTNGSMVAIPSEKIIIRNGYRCPDGSTRFSQ